jgi:hypothetical protein
MVRRSGRPAAGIEAVELAGLGFPIDGEEVAAEAVGVGLGDLEDGVGGNGCVDGGAACLENMRAPACEAKTSLVATMPYCVATTERP